VIEEVGHHSPDSTDQNW